MTSNSKTLPRLAALLFCLATSLTVIADKKIWVMNDIHIMDPSLLDTTDNTAWQADQADSKTMQELSVPIFLQLMEQIKTEKPDVLLIPGDLTKDAEPQSHAYVVEKLAEIEAAGIPVYVIPGNHDRGWMEFCRRYVNNSYEDVGYISQEDFRTLYRDFGYGEGSEQHSSDLTYATEIQPGLTLIGIDTGQTATIESDAVSWACQQAAAARDAGNQVIVMMHHSLLPHIYNQETLQVNSVVKQYESIRNQLMEAGVKVVFTAHYHTSDITRYTNASGQEIYDICTGSTLAYPCDYRVITMPDDFTSLSIATRSLTSLPPYEEGDFPTHAKERLKAAVENWAYNWISESINSFVAAALAPSVSDIFIIHAEGNEPQNPNSSGTVSTYELAAKLLSSSKLTELSLTIKSMLGDYPSEDDSNNVVDDRTLTITMPTVVKPEPDPETSISEVSADTAADNEAWYTFQGTRLTAKPTRPGIYIKGKRMVVISR